MATSHSMLEPGGDWLLADQVSSVLTKVATPWCTVDGPSEMEPRHLEDVISCAVCLLQEHHRCPVGISQVTHNLEFGGGKALDIELEHWQASVFDGRNDCLS